MGSVAVQIQQAHDTALMWHIKNPTLLTGEIGFESDTGYFKMGNGTTPWNDLEYSNVFAVSNGGIHTIDKDNTSVADYGGIAFGYNTISANNAIAIGSKTSSTDGAVSIGSNANSSVRHYTNYSLYSIVGRDAVAIGVNTKAHDGTVSIGKNAQSRVYQGVAIGSNTLVTMLDKVDSNGKKELDENGNPILQSSGMPFGVAIGSGAKSYCVGSYSGIAIGYLSNASGGVTIGYATTSDLGGVAIGHGSGASENSIALGSSVKSNSKNSVSIGYGTYTDNDVYGVFSFDCIAIGNSSKTSGNSSIAIGNTATAKSDYSCALGTNVQVLDYALGVGKDLYVPINSIGIGYGLNISSNQTVLGRYNEADVNNVYSFILGAGINENSRKNLCTIDHNGVTYFDGKVTVNANSVISNENDLITKQYHDNTIKDFATQNFVSNSISNATMNFITADVMNNTITNATSNFVTQDYVNNAISNKGYITEQQVKDLIANMSTNVSTNVVLDSGSVLNRNSDVIIYDSGLVGRV